MCGSDGGGGGEELSFILFFTLSLSLFLRGFIYTKYFHTGMCGRGRRGVTLKPPDSMESGFSPVL